MTKIDALIYYLENSDWDSKEINPEDIEIYKECPFDIYEYRDEQFYILSDQESEEWVEGMQEDMISDGKHYLLNHTDPALSYFENFMDWKSYGEAYCEDIETYFGEEIEYVRSDTPYNIYRLC